MNFETDCEALAATFNELTHLLVEPNRLTLENAELGVGGFGVVGLAILDKSSTSPRKVAVKQLQIMETSIVRQRIAFRLARELKVWAKMKHPNILELIGYYLSDNHGCAQFVSAYMVNGNVMQYIRRTRAGLAVRLKFVQDIAAGLKYLHDFSPPICHGDLKPANVLVKEGIDAVLCDFGVSSFIQESGAASGLTTSKSIKGSARYMSPELFPEEGNPKHTLQSDVWAWGCTVFEVMTESIPYPSKSTDVGVVIEMQKKSIPGSIEALGDLLVGTNVDPICQTGVTSLQWIILQCWDFDPTERPSSASILKDVAISFNAKTRSGDWGDGEAGISSLRIRDDFDYDGRASEGSVSSDESREIPLCANCQQHPKVEGREFCSRACLNEATSKRPNFGARAPNKYDLHDRNYRGGSGYRGSPSQGAASPYRASSLCINCQQHPKVKGRDFCSKACLNAAASLLTGSPKSDASGYHGFAGVAVPNVANSVQSPPYQVGNSREFAPIAYQGTGYADQAYQPIANWQQQRPPIAPAPQAAPQVLPRKPCKIMNCNGTESFPGSKYCSDKCLTLSVRIGYEIACLMCKELPKAPESDFCRQVCSDRAEQRAPLLLNIPKNDPKFPEILRMFDISWEHMNKRKPTVVFVYKIVQSKQLTDAYLAYQNKVESEGNFKAQGKPSGNECRWWHGTGRSCNVGDNPADPSLCTQTGCLMCSILRTSFQTPKVNTSGRNFHRNSFGKGICVYSKSSKAYDYPYNGGPPSQYSVILLVNVIAGQGLKYTLAGPGFTSPPPGYHSVFDESGGHYDKLAVYNDDAIRPSWLVVYQ